MHKYVVEKANKMKPFFNFWFIQTILILIFQKLIFWGKIKKFLSGSEIANFHSSLMEILVGLELGGKAQMTRIWGGDFKSG